MSRRAPAQDERDAWLSLALRHAPDANADAPPALSETILREARSAVARSTAIETAVVTAVVTATETAAAPVTSRGGRSNWFVSAWDWLARPPMAAGFGAVVAATLAGILWWGRPLDETLPHPPLPRAAAPQTRTEAAPGVLADARPGEREAAAAPPAPPSADKSHAKPQRAAKTEPAPKARPPVVAEKARRERGDSAAPSAAAAPAPSRAEAVQQAPEAAELRRESGASVADATAQRSSQSSSAAAKTTPLYNGLRAALGDSGRALAKAKPVDTPSAPLAELLMALAQQPERWSWQRGSAEPQAMNPALQRWLVQLDRSTASRWGAAFGPAPSQASGALRLLLDGVPRATLGFEAGGVRAEISGAGGAASALARVPQSVTAGLKKSLDEAAP